MENENQEQEAVVIVPAAPPAPKKRGRRPKLPVTVTGTPAEVVRIAIERGADPGQLKELLELQLRWERHQAEKAYQEEFLSFKQEPELKVLKDELVKFENRDGSVTEYRFSPLDKAEEILVPLLAKHKITHHWRLEPLPNNDVRVTCVLKHVLCFTNEDASLQGPPDSSGRKNFHQAIGSNVSYLQRYTLCAACGVTPKNVDTDARVADQQAPAEIGNGGNGGNLVPVLKASVKTALESSIKKCKTKNELMTLWASMTKDERKVLAQAKDERKQELGTVCQ